MTAIERADLEHPPVVHLRRPHRRRHGRAARPRTPGGASSSTTQDGLHGWISADETGDATVADRAKRMEAWVPVGASLKAAFAEMLQYDAGWVAVLDGDRFLGVLTPATLHEALRRSVDSDVLGATPTTSSSRRPHHLTSSSESTT